MKNLLIAALFAVAPPVLAQVQDSTTNAKLDTVMHYERALYNEIVRYKEPLSNKNYGIELNPAYLLVSASRSYLVVSGGFSFFSIDRRAEIACPFFYQSGTPNQEHQLVLLNQDLLYRRFLGQHQNGFYISGGLRFTHIKGEQINGISIFGIGFGPTSYVITTDKLGAMFGIGYRFFSSSGFYWGTSLVYGAYFSADERSIYGVTLDDTKTILDFDILKFGYAF
jgi:hypothetical protein